MAWMDASRYVCMRRAKGFGLGRSGGWHGRDDRIVEVGIKEAWESVDGEASMEEEREERGKGL